MAKICIVKIGIEKIDIENIHRRDMIEEIWMEKADRDERKNNGTEGFG